MDVAFWKHRTCELQMVYRRKIQRQNNAGKYSKTSLAFRGLGPESNKNTWKEHLNKLCMGRGVRYLVHCFSIHGDAVSHNPLSLVHKHLLGAPGSRDALVLENEKHSRCLSERQ